jgi:hypothetical protein
VALTFLVSLIFTCSTLIVPVKVRDRQAMADVWCGSPIAFLHQDGSGWDPPDDRFPLSWTCGNPWENPTTLHRGRFVASWALWTVALAVLRFLIRIGRRR